MAVYAFRPRSTKSPGGRGFLSDRAHWGNTRKRTGVVRSLPNRMELEQEPDSGGGTALRDDLIVLVDDDGHPIGTAPKLASHHRDTPLHLAFSAYVFRPDGQFLLTQRAMTKKTWPGMWTNSCCGHPAPDEPVEDAVRRRLVEELALPADEIVSLLPQFRYWAELDGVVENEICPVFGVQVHAEPELDSSEVIAHRWVDWDALLAGELSVPLTPWCQLQLDQLVGNPQIAALRGR